MAARSDAGRRDRGSRWWIVIGLAALTLGAAAVIPSPYLIERPGPVVNALGSIETEDGDTEVVRVSGTETYPSDGALNVLSVAVSGSAEQPSSWLSVASAWFDTTRAVVPVTDLYPEGLTVDERNEQNAALMRESQTAATAAALRGLGIEIEGTVRVRAVDDDGPASGVLREGDVLISADGEPAVGVEDLRAVLAERGSGVPVSLRILRDGDELDVAVVPVDDAAGTPVLGISVSSEYTFPFAVDLELDTIGGPSAGLVFALAITDRLTPGDLTGGLSVSATGTIDGSGAVGAIGGLQQKIWGAAEAGSDLMLMPLENCADVPERLPDGLRIAPVASLSEALAAVEALSAGENPAGLERCAVGSSGAGAGESP